MTQNPFYNALAATAYIVAIVNFIDWFTRRLTPPPESMLIPISVLSLFVLSTAVMGYLFLYNPLLLLIEGKRTEGLRLFLYTVGIFAVFTALVVTALFLL